MIELYPSTSKYARKGIGNIGNAGLEIDPNGPTAARPGSEEKIAVMIVRIEAGVSPFHPGDFSCASKES